MFEVSIILNLVVIIGLILLFWYLTNIKLEVLKDLETKRDENNEILGMIVQNFTEQISKGQELAKDGGFKDAQKMMKLRMEEFKFGLLSQFAEYASNKFMKVPLGVHQIVAPDTEEQGNVLKPVADGEQHG